MGVFKKGLAAAGALAAASAAGTAYFYNRTMIRQNAIVERTMKMAGTDWSQYSDILAERKAFAFAQPHEEVYVTSYDGLKLHATYLPAFPIINEADIVNRRLAGYGMDECNAKREVAKAKVPILFIHGSKDTFVPTYMCNELYDSCASKKQILIVEGAAHGESYFKEMDTYEKTLDAFIEDCEQTKGDDDK